MALPPVRPHQGNEYVIRTDTDRDMRFGWMGMLTSPCPSVTWCISSCCTDAILGRLHPEIGAGRQAAASRNMIRFINKILPAYLLGLELWVKTIAVCRAVGEVQMGRAIRMELLATSS